MAIICKKGGREDQHEDQAAGCRLRDEEQGSRYVVMFDGSIKAPSFFVDESFHSFCCFVMRPPDEFVPSPDDVRVCAQVVFIHVHVSIQYQTNSTHLFESYYSLSSPTRQLTSHVHDMIRSTMPRLDLDDIFSAQDMISYDFHRYLNEIMNPSGFLVHHALITRILPNEHVRRSMNEIQASKRTKEAMPHRAEAVRISTVKDAEAGAKRAHLIGIGVARERGEIARGMRDAVDGIVGGVGGGGVSVSAKGAMDLLLLTQYYDVLTDLGRPRWGREGDDGGECREESHGGTTSTSLFLMHTPDVVSRLSETARECFGSTNTVGDAVRVENLLDL